MEPTLLITTDNESFIRTVIISSRPSILLVNLGLATSASEAKKLMREGKVYHAKGNGHPIFWPVVRDRKLDISDGDIIQYNGRKIQLDFTSFKIEVDTTDIP